MNDVCISIEYVVSRLFNPSTLKRHICTCASDWLQRCAIQNAFRVVTTAPSGIV